MSRTAPVRHPKHKPLGRNAGLERRRAEARTRVVVATAVAKAVAAERQCIAHDLHDDLGGALALLAFRSADPTVRAVASQAMANMRGLLGAYLASDLSWQDWCADQRAHIALACECADVVLHWHSSGDAVLCPRTSLQLQRILREACTNALKHSGCTALQVWLHRDANGLSLRVCDNGRGLGVEKAVQLAQCVMGEGLGVPGMQLRAQRLGAVFNMGPAANGGCELCLTMKQFL